MIRKSVLTGTLIAITLSSAGCNTVKGFGRDVESVGQAGEDVISYAPADNPADNEVRDVQAAR